MRLPLGGRLTRPSLKLQLIFTKTADCLGACPPSFFERKIDVDGRRLDSIFFQPPRSGAP